MKRETQIYMNGEAVTINTLDGTLDWKGFRQYTNIQFLYGDLIEILLNHKIDGEEFVEYMPNTYYRLYTFKDKMYRVWFYSDGTMYIQHIDSDYNSIDDMMNDTWTDIYGILDAIVLDNQ